MCGIVCIFGATIQGSALRKLVAKMSKIQRHRGPDWSGIYTGKSPTGGADAAGVALAHERLSIVDPESGEQPLFGRDDDSLVLSVNGEIYNHKALRARYAAKGWKFRTKSDCEVILPLYEEFGAGCVAHLDGVFAFAVYDARSGEHFVARDPIGVNPLYVGYRRDGATVYASEMKCLAEHCERFELFLPGHFFHSAQADKGQQRWFEPKWWAQDTATGAAVPRGKLDLAEVRAGFERAVTKRMMSDVPWGVLLSGGLDSSLVASIAARHARRRTEDGGESEAWWPRMHSFSIGLEGSPDLAAAQKVATHLGTVHHGMQFSVQQGIDALSDVIYHLETCDTTTIRASTPMFLMARKIKAMGVKMVLSGEGADEVWAGYLYFHKAPDGAELHRETVRKIKELHWFDCLRANKSMSAFGVEVRVPFLDKDFLELAYGVDPDHKLCRDAAGTKRIEKNILRSAFDTKAGGFAADPAGGAPYLPDEVLWRQKEQFSDGVGYSWIDGLRDYAEAEVSDAQFGARAHRFPVNTPTTKEGYLYRSIFEEHYPQPSAVATCKGGPSVACSSSKAIEWDESFRKMAESTGGECSGRAIAGVHDFAYKAGEGARDDRTEGEKAKASQAGAGAGEPAAKRLRAQ